QTLDVIAVARGVSHGEETAPRMPEHVPLLELQVRAQRFKVFDLVVERTRLAGLERARAAVATLVVEDDASALAEGVKRCADVHVRVIEAGAAIENDERSARATPRDVVVELAAGNVDGLAVFVGG